MRFLTFILTVGIWIAGPVGATPERVTSSDDRIVAATPTHLYVLRDIYDNRGSHYAELRDQHLVEIEIETHTATQFWPLRRMEINNLPVDDFQVPGVVTDLDVETHDMFAILRDLGAAPMAPHEYATQDLEMSDEDTLVEGGETVRATLDQIKVAARDQLSLLQGFYPPSETEEEFYRADKIEFYELDLEHEWECELLQEGITLFRQEGRVPVVKLHCENWDQGGSWSFHFVLH